MKGRAKTKERRNKEKKIQRETRNDPPIKSTLEAEPAKEESNGRTS